MSKLSMKSFGDIVNQRSSLKTKIDYFRNFQMKTKLLCKKFLNIMKHDYIDKDQSAHVFSFFLPFHKMNQVVIVQIYVISEPCFFGFFSRRY